MAIPYQDTRENPSIICHITGGHNGELLSVDDLDSTMGDSSSLLEQQIFTMLKQDSQLEPIACASSAAPASNAGQTELPTGWTKRGATQAAVAISSRQ